MILKNKFIKSAVLAAVVFCAPLLYSSPEKDSSAGAAGTAASHDSAAPKEALYKAAGAIMIIWLGISVYLFSLDRKISRIEREINEK